MSESNSPRIVFSERLSTGIVVHFETGVPVFFPAHFLYEQRAAQPDMVFREDDEEGDEPQHSNGDHPPPREAVDDASHWRVGEHAPRSTEATTKQTKKQKTK